MNEDINKLTLQLSVLSLLFAGKTTRREIASAINKQFCETLHVKSVDVFWVLEDFEKKDIVFSREVITPKGNKMTYYLTQNGQRYLECAVKSYRDNQIGYAKLIHEIRMESEGQGESGAKIVPLSR